MIDSLERHGLGRDISGHYVAASAVAFATTLPFVVGACRANEDEFTPDAANKIELYFLRGQVGVLR